MDEAEKALLIAVAMVLTDTSNRATMHMADLRKALATVITPKPKPVVAPTSIPPPVGQQSGPGPSH
jgi:hypothetical protein